MKRIQRRNIIANWGFLLLFCLIFIVYFFAALNYFKAKERNAIVYSNGIKNSDTDFYIRQHGQYLVLYNYIRAKRVFTGNESVTLILHADWTDILNLEETLTRWNGPITLSLFTYGTDVHRAARVLAHLMYCSKERVHINNFLSINLIMHRGLLLKYLTRWEPQRYLSMVDCLEKFDLANNERVKRRLIFPSNLARNVGRTTARTHFVLLLDAEYVPSLGIPELFLKMIKANEHNIIQPKRTAYVLPAFDIKSTDIMPATESDLKHVDQEVLQLYLNSTSLHKVPRLRTWLQAKKTPTGIFNISKRWSKWLAYYITVNNIEPFYNENYDGVNRNAGLSFQLDLLEALKYNFYVVNFGFVARHLLPPYQFYTETPLKNDTAASEKMQKTVEMLRSFFENLL